MGCCLGGCLRLLFFWLWRALLAALIALIFARVDAYIERRELGETMPGRAWRYYRSRGKKPPRPEGTSGPTEL